MAAGLSPKLGSDPLADLVATFRPTPRLAAGRLKQAQQTLGRILPGSAGCAAPPAATVKGGAGAPRGSRGGKRQRTAAVHAAAASADVSVSDSELPPDSDEEMDAQEAQEAETGPRCVLPRLQRAMRVGACCVRAGPCGHTRQVGAAAQPL